GYADVEALTRYRRLAWDDLEGRAGPRRALALRLDAAFGAGLGARDHAYGEIGLALDARVARHFAAGVGVRGVGRAQLPTLFEILFSFARLDLWHAIDLRLGTGVAIAPGDGAGLAWRTELALPLRIGPHWMGSELTLGLHGARADA